MPRIGPVFESFDYERGDVSRLKSALLEHGMVIVRGRTLTPFEQVSFTRLFGSVVHTAPKPAQFLPDRPEIFRMANRKGVGNVGNGNYWHSDGTHMDDPSALSFHHIFNATADGSTLYQDMARAYDRLANKDIWDGAKMTIAGSRVRDIVQSHPVTGRKFLYVNLGTESEFPGRDTMVRHLNDPKSYYKHVWQNGDLVIADNFRVAHCATLANPRHLRILHRTSIPLSAVWYNQKDIPS